MHVVELLLLHGRGRVHQQIARLGVHGEGDDFADIDGIRNEHDHAVDAGRHARVGRRAVLEGVIERGELRRTRRRDRARGTS